ncbi:WD repeat-containing protein 76 isoform X1 [Sinocyclocheilus rhinocerous]|uniref:WD repeat-containing protein 76 n=1 Tax=Sinocyclocheilus rhinocerous TaxID=307959 RepID=A0A673MT83_9TELE|nr:PREDICTED: WD repeat-containing protein 76-like isoform X1 [Sinocyclocheilus rhinocerous]
MDENKIDLSLKTMQLLQERTPPQDPGMDGPVRRTSRRIREKQNQEKNQILSPKCLTFTSEKNDSEEEEDIEEAEVKDDKESLPGYREGLSEYELERLENIRQNQAFLNTLNLPQISEALRPKPKPTQKGLKREKTESEMLPVRKSLRLQNKGPQTTLTLDTTSYAAREPEDKPKKAPGPIPLDPINLDEHVRLPEDLVQLWNEVPLKQEAGTSDLILYQQMLQKLSINDSCVVKVVKDRICSAAFHPTSSNLLMAAGDKSGHLGLWKPDASWGDDGVIYFEPHSRAITSMAFSSHPCNLITVSYDGSARSMDLEKAVFDEVYRSSSGLKSFDFLSADCSSLLLGEWNGDVAVVDRRTEKIYESLYTMAANPLRCVHVHPVQQHYFVVAESRFVNIYDLRHLKRRNNLAVGELNGHSRSVSSAFFSPLTGNRVLTTCMDNTIRVFDTSLMEGRSPVLKSITHNMQTGRWLSKLSAVWDPKQQDCFVIGSVDRPRRIQVYHESGRRLHTFRNMDHLTTVCSITAFHPSRNTLLGGNSSGRLHIFTDSFIN